MSSLTCVDIVLSLYNGERFLKAQIESIQRQEHVHWRLWVRDDGSKDASREIVNHFAASDPRIRWSPSSSVLENFGPTQSFSMLLESLPSDSQYFLLCDQDDVWSPKKIAKLLLTLENCSEAERSQALLIFSDLILIDDRDKMISNSQMSFMNFRAFPTPCLAELCAQNIMSGCSVMGNISLLKAALPIPKQALMHDWWLGLIATSQGKVLFFPDPLVAYRQHSHNVSGGSQTKGIRAAWDLWKKRTLYKIMESRFVQINVLQNRLSQKGGASATLEKILEIPRLSPRQRCMRALEIDFLPQGFKRQMLFLLLLIFWKSTEPLGSTENRLS